MTKSKRLFGVLSVTIMLALILAGCSGTATAQTGTNSSGFTGYGTVNQVSYTNTVESTGQIQPQHIASINFSATGIVAQSLAQVGQTVNAGDILMSLDPATVPANLASAQTDLTNAKNALIQLTSPDLSTISNAGKTLSTAYTNYQQAQNALTNAIISNQTAAESALYNTWLDSKKALDTAQNDLPLANASIDVQAFYQAVRDTSLLQDQLTTAESNAGIHPTDTALAQKVTDLKKTVQDNQTKQDNLQAALSPSVVDLVTTLSTKLDAYDTAASNFIGLVVTSYEQLECELSPNPG